MSMTLNPPVSIRSEVFPAYPDQHVTQPVRLLVVVEGEHDIAFLKRISRSLHRAHAAVPDLEILESVGRLAFVPAGGSNVARWIDRLAGLGLPEFHLYDREAPPLTRERQQVVAKINSRPGCTACLTSKRSLENYLHPAAIQEARGITLAFGDAEDVPDLTARAVFEARHAAEWDLLSSRAKRRLRDRAKKWLNRLAAERMTPDRLAVRDPDGDVCRWLRTMAEIVG